MKGSSKFIMWATLSMAITLAIVLALVLILLCDLYCSLFLSRRCRHKPLPPTSAASPATASLGTLLGQGVLNAPRSILFPTSKGQSLENKCNLDLEKQDPSDDMERLVYICNPIYDNSAVGPSGAHSPYETPESSPSNLGFSDDDGEEKVSPELVPMKKLQAEACSVSLRDASSLATSPSESEANSKNGVSTTMSGSPSTSSW